MAELIGWKHRGPGMVYMHADAGNTRTQWAAICRVCGNESPPLNSEEEARRWWSGETCVDPPDPTFPDGEESKG